MKKIDAIREAKKVIETGNFPNVQGVGIGYKVKNGKKTKELGVIVFVDKKLTEAQLTSQGVIPKTVAVSDKDVKTDVVESGTFKSLELTDRMRPIVPGYSVGHPDITAGTLSCIVLCDGELCILSNNHVLANVNKAQIGDPIVQPGTYDGGSLPDDIVATLYDYVKIETLLSQCKFSVAVANLFNFFAKKAKKKTRQKLTPIVPIGNLVDCAVALIAPDTSVQLEVPNIGIPTGMVDGDLGMRIRKTGRTSEYTEGEITAVEATINVQMGEAGIAVFTDQIISDIPSAGGDSGSAVFDDGTNLVGLLFAGGEGITVLNRIQNVFEALDLELP